MMAPIGQATVMAILLGQIASGLNLGVLKHQLNAHTDDMKVNADRNKTAGRVGSQAEADADTVEYIYDWQLGQNTWSDSVAIGNKAVGIPERGDRIVVYDVENKTLEYITDPGLRGSHMWKTSAGVGNKVVGLPSHAGKIVVYDVETKTVEYNTDEGLSQRLYGWYTSVGVGNKVVGLPYYSQKIVVYDVETKTVEYNTDAGLRGNGMWHTSVAMGNKVVGLPMTATKVVVYDVETKTVEYNTDGGETGGLWLSMAWATSVGVGNKVVGLPLFAGKILVYNLDSNSVEYTTDAGLSGQFMWWTSVGVGNKVVGLPSHAGKIVVYDVETKTVEYNTDEGLAGTWRWTTSARMGNKVVGIPNSGDKVVVYDVDSKTVEYHTSPIPPSGLTRDFWRTSVGVGNQVVGIPFYAYEVAVFNSADVPPTTAPTTPTPSPTPAPTTCQDAGTCSIYEDPHIKVFDGMQISLLGGGRLALADNHGAGDYWLVRSSDISIQARYKPDPDMPEHNMFVEAVAVGGPMLNGSTLVLGSLNDRISWNGETILESQTSEFHADLSTGTLRAQRHLNSHLVEDMTHSNAGVDIDLPQGVKLTVNRLQHHVNLFIEMHPATGGQDGLCGNFNCNAYDDALGMILRNRDPKVRPGDSLFKA